MKYRVLVNGETLDYCGVPITLEVVEEDDVLIVGKIEDLAMVVPSVWKYDSGSISLAADKVQAETPMCDGPAEYEAANVAEKLTRLAVYETCLGGPGCTCYAHLRDSVKDQAEVIARLQQLVHDKDEELVEIANLRESVAELEALVSLREGERNDRGVEIAKLRAALEQYADHGNWQSTILQKLHQDICVYRWDHETIKAPWTIAEEVLRAKD